MPWNYMQRRDRKEKKSQRQKTLKAISSNLVNEKKKEQAWHQFRRKRTEIQGMHLPLAPHRRDVCCSDRTRPVKASSKPHLMAASSPTVWRQHSTNCPALQLYTSIPNRNLCFRLDLSAATQYMPAFAPGICWSIESNYWQFQEAR